VVLLDLNARQKQGMRFPHGCEVLAFDFDKYRPGMLVTGAVDGLVRVWDARNPTSPVSVLHGGHRMAVRKVKTSPWTAGEVATVSYDLSLCHWRDAYSGAYSIARKCERLHKEFVWGLDWSLHDRSLVATAGWDRTVHFVDLSYSE
jgi:peroxin-7